MKGIQEWLLRSLSGGLYIAVFVGGLLLGYESCALLLLLFSLFSLWEFYSLCGRIPGALHLYRWNGLLVALLLFLWQTIPYLKHYPIEIDTWIALTQIILPVSIALLLFPFRGLLRDNAPARFIEWALSAVGVLYVVVPFVIMLRMSILHGAYDWRWALFPLILIWANDTGAFVFGSLFGRHKLLERVSPGKTWEGFAGGVVSSAGVGILLSNWAPAYGTWSIWCALGVLVSLSSTVGDLVESQLKRSLGVKDSGRFLPGHGGFLDRFDSLLLTAPVSMLYFSLIPILPIYL